MLAAEDEDPVSAFAADGADPAFGIAFARGARTGVRRRRMASLANTASNMPVNLLSRSRIKKVN